MELSKLQLNHSIPDKGKNVNGRILTERLLIEGKEFLFKILSFLIVQLLSFPYFLKKLHLLKDFLFWSRSLCQEDLVQNSDLQGRIRFGQTVRLLKLSPETDRHGEEADGEKRDQHRRPPKKASRL